MQNIQATKLSRFICFLCCLPFWVTAGDGYRFRYIDLPEALRDATINCATADRAGLLWFFSSSGLHRYDGNQLLTFNQVSRPAIAGNFINTIFADSRDRIWIGTRTGLTRFDLRRWQTQTIGLPEEQELYVTEICESRNGDIYLGTNDGRLLRVKGNGLELVVNLARNFPSKPSRGAISFLHEAGPGRLVVVSNGRLLCVSPDGAVQDPGLGERVTGPVYCQGKEEVLFNIAGKGLHAYNLETRRLMLLPPPFNDTLNNGKREFLFSLPGGETGFLVNKRGLFSYHPATGQVTERMKGLDVDFAGLRASDVRTSGNKVYISLSKSIAELEAVQTPFANLLVNPFELAMNSVRSILLHPNGLLYAGTYSNGFVSINERTGEKKILGNMFVYASLLWDEKKLLLATEGDGLQWYHIAENRFERIMGDTLHTRQEDRATDLYYTSLLRENDSIVWVGGYNGVFRINPVNGRSAYLRAGKDWPRLQRSKVYGILNAGKLRYFATIAGLFSWEPSTNRLQRLTDVPMYQVQQFGRELWAGTNGRGLLILDEKGAVIQELNTENGLAGNAVYFILRQGNEVIAGTDHGLSVIQLQTREISNYTRMHNLPSNEFNHSSACIAGGRVYLGTINGITTFRMEDLQRFRRQASIPLHFTSFSFSNGDGGAEHVYTLPYQKPERLEIAAGVEYFSLRFGGIDAAANQVYYYRTHTDAPWLEIGRQREMSFAGMAPGRYNIQLAARLNGSTSYTTLLAVPLIVHPAWYQTWWFKVLCGIGLLLCGWLFFRYRMQQVLREQKLRTKIAGDLHDEVGSSLTRIYFQADHLSMRHQDKAALQKIADSSKHALSTMSDMVWSIDARFDTAADLVTRMRDYLSNLQNDLDIKCIFELEGDYMARPLSQSVRQNFFLIFKEATNNAARYSSEPCIKVQLAFHKQIYLRVTNSCTSVNGKMKQYQGGRGMEQMRSRAARMKGRLEAEKKDNDFVLQLEIPA